PVGGVTVPGEPGIREADMLALAVPNIRDQQDLGMTRQQVFFDDMDLELAKAPAEGDVLLVGEALVAEEHHDVVMERPLELAKGRLVDRRRQIEHNLRAAGRLAFVDRDRHGKRLAATRPNRKAPHPPTPQAWAPPSPARGGGLSLPKAHSPASGGVLGWG